MQFDVNIRLYEYWHEQVKIRKKRWNNKEIYKFYWKWICKQKVRKRGVGPCHECLWFQCVTKILLKVAFIKK